MERMVIYRYIEIRMERPKPGNTNIQANMVKHLFMLEKSVGLGVHCLALWSLMSLWGWLLLAPTWRCWLKTSQPSFKNQLIIVSTRHSTRVLPNFMIFIAVNDVNPILQLFSKQCLEGWQIFLSATVDINLEKHLRTHSIERSYHDINQKCNWHIYQHECYHSI